MKLHLVNSEEETNLFFNRRKKLHFGEPGIKDTWYPNYQNLFITDDLTIESGDWYLYCIDGKCHRPSQRVRQNSLAEYPYPVYSKIISSNTKLTPEVYISDNDLKCIVKYWNENKKLPDIELEMEEYADYDFLGMPCVGFKRIKTVNNKVIIKYK